MTYWVVLEYSYGDYVAGEQIEADTVDNGMVSGTDEFGLRASVPVGYLDADGRTKAEYLRRER